MANIGPAGPAPLSSAALALAHSQPATARQGVHLKSVDQRALLAETQADLSELLAGTVVRSGRGRRSDGIDTAPTERTFRGRDALGRREHIEAIAAELADGKLDWQAAFLRMQGLFPSTEELASVLAELRRHANVKGEIRAEIDKSLAALARVLGEASEAQLAELGPLFLRAFGKKDAIKARQLFSLYRSFLAAGSGSPALYRYLLEACGMAERGAAVDFVERAGCADIHVARVTRMLDDVYPMPGLIVQLRMLRCADQIFLAEIGRALAQVPRATNPATIDRLERAWLSLLLTALTDEAAATQMLTECLQDALREYDLAATRLWAQGVYRGLDRIPVEVFVDIPTRAVTLRNLLRHMEDWLRPLSSESNALQRSDHG